MRRNVAKLARDEILGVAVNLFTRNDWGEDCRISGVYPTGSFAGPKKFKSFCLN